MELPAYMLKAKLRMGTTNLFHGHQDVTTLGSYANKHIKNYKTEKVLEHELEWRKRFFLKHKTIKEYDEAPRDLKNDLNFYPTP